MYSAHICCFILLLFSCSNEKEPQPISGDVLIPRQSTKKNKTESTKNTFFFDTSAYHYHLRNDSLKLYGSIQNIARNKEFIDRFAKDSMLTISVNLAPKKNLKHQIHFFKDSLQSKNAFYNWLDEVKMSSVENKKSLSKKTTYFILSEKHFQIFELNSKIKENQLLFLAQYFIKKDKVIYFLVSNQKETIWHTITKKNTLKL